MMFSWKLYTNGTNGLNNDGLELVGYLRHETSDLLHESIDTSFIPSLQNGNIGMKSRREYMIR